MLPTTRTAHAASFDCTKARTPHERHICNDPALDSADALLGAAYQTALATVPIKGFVPATQRRFLIRYAHCDEEFAAAYAPILAQRTQVLASMPGSVIYTNLDPGRPFTPEAGVFWVATNAGRPTLHDFGGYMPDMNTPEPFPAGFVCDDEAPLRPTPSGWITTTGDEVVISGPRLTSTISCSPRNGLMGEYRRIR